MAAADGINAGCPSSPAAAPVIVTAKHGAFYPGLEPRQHRYGTAATFEVARAGFEADWNAPLAKPRSRLRRISLPPRVADMERDHVGGGPATTDASGDRPIAMLLRRRDRCQKRRPTHRCGAYDSFAPFFEIDNSGVRPKYLGASISLAERHGLGPVSLRSCHAPTLIPPPLIKIS